MPNTRLSELQFQLDTLHTALAVGYGPPAGWISHMILPPYPNIGDETTIRAPVFGKEMHRVMDTGHALRTKPKQTFFRVDFQDATLEDHALEAPYDPREAAAAALYGIDVEMRSILQAKYGVELKREYDGAQLLQTASNYAVGFSEITAAGSGWNEFAAGPPKQSNVDPVEVILAKAEIIRQANGRDPNFVAMGKATWDAFATNTYVIDRIKGGDGGPVDKQRVTPAQAARFLAFDEAGENEPTLLIGKGTSLNDATGAFDDMWADNCIIGIRDPNPTETPLPYFGVTLCQVYAEFDGVPAFGAAGRYFDHQWSVNPYYTSRRGLWIAKNDAAYLITDLVKP